MFRNITWQSLAFYFLAVVVGTLGGKYYLALASQQSDQQLRNATIKYDRRGQVSAVYYWREKVAPLAEFKQLAHLDLRNRNLSNEELGIVAGLTLLQRINVGNNQITDDGLLALQHLSNLTSLTLSENAGVTDAGLEHLTGLARLERIDVRMTSVTPKGLRRLKEAIPGIRIDVDPLELSGLQSLRALGANVEVDEFYDLLRLDLARTETTDLDLELLRGLDQLKMLHLGETRVTDVGMSNLGGLTSLEELWLSDTEISSEGLTHLQALANLKQLSLARTNIDAEGLVNLKRLTNLTTLHLSDTNISDPALENLFELQALTELWLNGTNVTSAGIARLQEKLPDVSVMGHEISTARPVESHVKPG